ncbi:hypothetical protein IW261DRAFT_1421991 [Armillaria novae-zelandiae]|uniref:Uncharacterized protein n=1 Tax=Armillaria novae-zelandiae TaxID=153914 RepID=A0AA39P194_9AGAR|nr:hypothetical protein IW261DRAFT_1421991 [Armillaria novae-zelandiae]
MGLKFRKCAEWSARILTRTTLTAPKLHARIAYLAGTILLKYAMTSCLPLEPRHGLDSRRRRQMREGVSDRSVLKVVAGESYVRAAGSRGLGFGSWGKGGVNECYYRYEHYCHQQTTELKEI